MQHINQRRVRPLIPTEYFTLVTRAIEHVKTQTIFYYDTYESRRQAMKVARLLKVLALFQMFSNPGQRKIDRVVEPLGESENALPLQIVAAFVPDLAFRAFKH